MFKRRYGWGSLIVVSLLILQMKGTTFAKADTTKLPQDSKATFMLMPDLPQDNLGGQHLGYFNLKLKSGQKRTIRLKVFNPTDRPLTIYGQMKDATTSDNAVVDYLGTNQIAPHLLKQPGSQFVKVPAKTRLRPNEMKWIAVTIKMPPKQFIGQKATAINLSANQLVKKTAVKNHYVYAIALILNGKKLTAKQQQPLRTTEIKTRLTKQQQAAISVAIENPNPAYLKNATIQINLQNQRWSLIGYHDQKRNRKIAPSSRFYEDVLLGGKRLVAGRYRMTLTVKADGKRQVIRKNVEISQGQARYINQNNAQYLRNRNSIMVGSVLLVVMGGAVVTIKAKENKRKRGV